MEAGRRWFRSLTREAKWELGDALVLGTFDRLEWGFDAKLPPGFLRGVDDARILWEMDGSP